MLTACVIWHESNLEDFSDFLHVSCVAQVKNYQLYVRREIQNQSSLRHPLIVSLREASIPTHLTLQASGNAINSSLSVQDPAQAVMSRLM